MVDSSGTVVVKRDKPRQEQSRDRWVHMRVHGRDVRNQLYIYLSSLVNRVPSGTDDGVDHGE
jgi:hypothetical protein